MNLLSCIVLLHVSFVFSWEDKVRLEAELVDVLRDLAGQMEHALKSIQTYTLEVDKIFTAECPEEDCPSEFIIDRIVGNPIYNYQLLKRVLVFFKKVEEAIQKIDIEDAVAKINRAKRKYGGMPSEDDAISLGKNIFRLLETYDLDIETFSRGIIGTVSTGARLTASDLFSLGQLGSNIRNSDISVKILRALRARNSSELDISQREFTRAEGLLKLEERNLNSRKAAPEGDRKGEEGDQDEDGEPNTFTLGFVPPKTTDRSKMLSKYDHVNYHALCRGQTILNPDILKDSKCFYSHQNVAYYMLHPIAIEEVYPEPHRILIFHNVLTDRETDLIAEAARPYLSVSSIGAGKEISETRVSQAAFIDDGVSSIIDRVNLRINDLTGLSGTMLSDKEGKVEEFEYLQIASYQIGGHFYLHHDPMFVYKDSNFIAKSIENPSSQYNTGDRMSTLMFYLNEVKQGGYTMFPRLGVAVRPERGSAVFWHNIDANGFSDMLMLHAACPVLLGKKVVANKWFREVANVFHRKCDLSL